MSRKPHTTLTTEIFIERAKMIHGDRYDYSQVEYVNWYTKVLIGCKEHGRFYQRPNNHTSHKQGCPRCEAANKKERNRSRALETSEFVSRAKKLHNGFYEYTKTNYIASNKPVTITCPQHGDFVVARAEKHLYGQGCKACTKLGSSGERRIAEILDQLDVTYNREQPFDGCVSPYTNRKLRFDFYIPQKNILIEFDGIQHRKKSPLFHRNEEQFIRSQVCDEVKTTYALSNGFELYRFTESDFDTLAGAIKSLVV